MQQAPYGAFLVKNSHVAFPPLCGMFYLPFNVVYLCACFDYSNPDDLRNKREMFLSKLQQKSSSAEVGSNVSSPSLSPSSAEVATSVSSPPLPAAAPSTSNGTIQIPSIDAVYLYMLCFDECP